MPGLTDGVVLITFNPARTMSCHNILYVHKHVKLTLYIYIYIYIAVLLSALLLPSPADCTQI